MLVRTITILVLFLFLGCGDYPTSSSYRDSSSNLSCDEICENHCEICWSWQSDILVCQRDCSSLCKRHGCDYIDVPSSTCDSVFQDVCK